MFTLLFTVYNAHAQLVVCSLTLNTCRPSRSSSVPIHSMNISKLSCTKSTQNKKSQDSLLAAWHACYKENIDTANNQPHIVSFVVISLQAMSSLSNKSYYWTSIQSTVFLMLAEYYALNFEYFVSSQY